MARAKILATLVVVAQCDFSFVAIGDWGGEDDHTPVTESQRLTADGMIRTARRMGTNFTLMMGDNFYSGGIKCAADATPRFAQTFEEVYAARLPGQPFYAIAGNHDYGHAHVANVSSQLAYSDMSPQWNFPSLWYSLRREFTADGQARTFKLILIDTVSLCGIWHLRNESSIDVQLEFLGEAADPTRPGHLRQKVAERQWAWLKEELQEGADVDYLWVSGHYPLWSAGGDGSQPCLSPLLPLLQDHHANYISGHDHNLEHFAHGGIHTFVVGAGKECCYPPDNLYNVPAGALRFFVGGPHGSWGKLPGAEPVLGGFASLRFAAEHVTVTIHQHSGKELYAVDIPRHVGTAPLSWAIISSSVFPVFFLAALVVRQRRATHDPKHYILLSE